MAIRAILFWAGAIGVGSEGFLSAQVDRRDVEKAFIDEISAFSSSARLARMEDKFKEMFAALPKNELGNIANPTVKYALHRHFSHSFGWQVKGLTNAGENWNSSSSTGFMKDRVSSYIFELFDRQLNGKGFDIRNLAIFASVMEDLVNQEAAKVVERIFELLGLSTTGGAVQAEDLDRASSAFTAASMLGRFRLDYVADVVDIERKINSAYPKWSNTQMWVTDVRLALSWAKIESSNPFVPRGYTFSDALDLSKKIMYGLGIFDNAECTAIKDILVEMDPDALGRVALADYYANDQIDFHESMGSLRDLGVLDETDPAVPSIVIPNILGMAGNCAMSTEYYSVCCIDECEGLLRTLEQNIQAPSAKPARIAEIVSQLGSSSVDAPRNLSTLLMTRLDDIAKIHGGEVLLHGRLFMQWMHHAYPRECVFPHVSGTVNKLSSWSMVSREEKERVMVKDHSRDSMSLDQKISALPWSSVEELVVGSNRPAPKSSVMSRLRFMVGVLALASIALPVMRSSKLTASSESIEKLCV